jgi:hypothetical protein
VAEAADFQGMGHSPARRWLRRTAALIAGAPLLAGLLAVTAAPAAHAGEAAATGPHTADVALDTLSPSAPVPGDTLTVSGTVTNKSKRTLDNATVNVEVGPQLSGRVAIDDAAERSDDASVDVPPIGGKYKVNLPKLISGVPYDFKLAIPVSKLGLGEDGVYQLGVSLNGATTDLPYEHTLGAQRTFLPWQPEATEKKTQLTYLWPLISTTHLTAETGSDEQQTPVFANDDLATDLAPGGRLQQLVALGDDLPVTWVIDPDLLASVDAMTRGYRVRSGSTTVPGKSQAVANQWLDALDKAVRGHKVVALPFSDPDLASLAHRGKNVSGSLSHLQPATEVARSTVATILHVDPSTDFAWPVDGAIDPSIVDVATSGGAHKIITRSDSLQDNLPYSPNAARPIGGGTTAVVADAQLSTGFQGDLTTADNSILAIQKFLAQSLALTLQQPSKQRSVVVAPQRMPTAAQAQSMASTLRTLGPERWTQPSNLIAAAAAKPDADANTKVPSTSRYPKKLRDQELPTSAFQQIADTQSQLDNFKAILSAPDRVEAPFANALYRAMATSWRGNPTGAQQYRDGVQNYLLSLTNGVQLIHKSVLTLSGRSATIPVTVQNQLVQGVEHLTLRLTSSKPNRLKIDADKKSAEEPIKIDGEHSQSVKFTGAGNATGPVSVTAQLYTLDGKPYGRPMTFKVKVSEITPTVMLVIAGGVLLLVLAGAKMYSRRKRAAARKAAAEPADPEDPPGGPDDPTDPVDPKDGADSRNSTTGTKDTQGTKAAEDTVPEQPSDPEDPEPDTGPENAKASGTGEKVNR